METEENGGNLIQTTHILKKRKYEPKNFITKWKGNCVILVFRIDGVENMHGHKDRKAGIYEFYTFTRPYRV